MSDTPDALVHASCVAIGGRAILLAGPPGAGKSDLALRLIDRGARLGSDDYTELRRVEGRLLARAPATIAGKIEVQGRHDGRSGARFVLRFPEAPEE